MTVGDRSYPPGVNVVGLTGGLGNQLFQLSLGKELELATSRPTLYDTSAYRSRPTYFALPELGFDIPELSWTRWAPHAQGRFGTIARYMRRIAGPREIVFEMPHQEFQPHQLGAWYYGYWQAAGTSDRGVREVRRHLTSQVAARSGPRPLAAIHVRRGDLVTQDRSWDASSLDRAVEALEVSEETPITIVTDDYDWCAATFTDKRFHVLRGGTPAQDFLTLASSSRLVLSRSTFSWWAAEARDREPNTVVAPASLAHDHGTFDQEWVVLG